MAPDLPTPAFLVDRRVARANAARMREKAAASGVRLRPHVKTHKTLEGARMQLGAASGPITVSTLAEAEAFAAWGFDDLTYAVPIDPDKVPRAAALAARVKHLGVLVDGFEAAEAVIGSGAPIDVWLEVDCGYHRTGADPRAERTLALARKLSSPRFAGLLTHAGHSYDARTAAEIAAVAREEAAALAELAGRMRAAGLDPVCRSLGATPTLSVVERIEGADEVRPGNYLFYDAFQAAIGACRLEDVAVSVLTSVIGVYPEERRFVVDAGALALSKDRGADHLPSAPGYGIVCDLDGRPLPVELRALSQEHGRAYVKPGAEMPAVHVGTRLRVVPNHSCLTAAMFERYHVVEGGEVVETWSPVRGW